MNNRRAFTLIELMGVLVVLSIIFLISFPILTNIIKNTNDKIDDATKKIIYDATTDYLDSNKDDYPKNDLYTYCISLQNLIDAGDLTSKQIASLDNTNYYVKTTFTNSVANYNLTTSCTEDTSNSVLKLVGNKNTTIEVGTDNRYVDLGATLTSSDGSTSSVTSYTIKDSKGTTYDHVDTSKIKNYILTYTSSYDGSTYTAVRTVSVVDTTAPTITLLSQEDDIYSNQKAYDLTSGVAVSDNSGATIKPVITSNLSLGMPGTYTVTYIATDLSGNTSRATKKIVITKAYTDAILNGADPELVPGMIPVNIASDGTVTKADVTTSWYDYTNKNWANIVLVSSSSRAGYTSAAAGSTINQSDILGYFVWIPRYRYQLFNVAGTSGTTASQIAITFENKTTTKSSGTTNGSWLTAPGFTFGSEELNGIWVGKFETTGTGTSPTVLPNVTSLRNQNVSSEFVTSLLFTNRTFSTAGVISSLGTNTTYGIANVDSHMAKNSEWSTVAYLAESKYGRCTSGTCTEVSINNSSSFITGSSAGIPGDSTTTSSTVYAYNTTQGYLATTTGNISGVYDMSGGAWDCVMGDMLDTNNKPYSGKHSAYNSGFNGTFGNLTTTTEGADNSITSLTTGYNFPDSKYYETYGSSELTACNGGVCVGDSISETRGWYGDYSSYVTTSYPWFIRGGNYTYGAGAGVFTFYNGTGAASSYFSFRTIITN